MERVGRAIGLSGGARTHFMAGFEQLEDRRMLEGTFGTAIFVDVSAGRGSAAGAINPSIPTTDNDYYSFTSPISGFVSVLADTSNEDPASALNTRVEVFRSNQQLIKLGTNNGTLTSGLATDGWVGFIAEAGQSYFVRVSSESGMGPGTPGTYTLRVNGENQLFTIGGEMPIDTGIARELNSPVPMPPFVPITPILGQLGGTALPFADRTRQDEIVYRYDVPAGTQWDSLVTIGAVVTRPIGNPNRLDTRLDVYDALGQVVASDSDAGRLNDAFTVVRAKPGDTFFIRVRSDEVGDINPEVATGPFFLVLDAIASQIAMNPVTRRGADAGGAFDGFGPPTIPANPTVPNPAFQTKLYEFVAQGDGLAFITALPRGIFSPVRDPAITLYDNTGARVAFNDNFAGVNAQIQAQLTGGQKYYIVVDGFEVTSLTDFSLFIEANHSFQPNPDPLNANDDHVDTFVLPQSPTQADRDNQRRQFELATGLVFGPAFTTLDADRNLVRDRGLRTTAQGTGRIHGVGDRDLFQFTPQVDMLTAHNGNNDDVGTSLFAGGIFDNADPNNPRPTESRNLSIWDAQDWWYTGRQDFDPVFQVTYGFNDNMDATSLANGPEIYAMLDYDPGTPANPPQGMSRRVLIVAGDFDLIIPTPFGPQTFKNIAFWAQNFNTGRWGWGGLGDVDGPVRALTSYLPDDQIPSINDPTATIPTNRPVVAGAPAPYLVIGGSFTSVDGVGANNIATFDAANGWLPIGTGTNGPVHALTSYDPADVGAARPGTVMPPLPAVVDSRNTPNSLILGGEFTTFDGLTVSNLGLWDGVDTDNVWAGPFSGPRSGAGPNGPVFALSTYTGWDPDAMIDTEVEAAPRVLIVGGDFTSISDGEGNVLAANDLAAWGFLGALPGDNRDPMSDQYAPRGWWEEVGGGIAAPNANGDPVAVLALAQWDPPDINNTTIDPVLVIGGSFNVGLDNIIAFAVNAAGPVPVEVGFGWFNGSVGTNGIVRSLTTLTDQQEPGIATDLNSGVPQQVLYIGGDFTEVTNAPPPANPVAALHVAQFSAFHDPNSGQDFFAFTAMNGGVQNASNTATVFALSGFDDGNPLEWDRHDRRNTRLAITLATAEGSFINTRVRVYDSNFNIVYGFNRPGSETIAPPNPDPSGMIDGSLAAPTFTIELEGITLWGGETYYIEVSDYAGTDDQNPTARGGTGRYTLTVTTDAEPTDLNGDNVLDDVNANYIEVPDEGRFSASSDINTTLATGDGTITRGSDTQPLKGNIIRTQKIYPSTGLAAQQRGDLGNISRIRDTDLYSFRAEFTGTVEIRVATTDIVDAFGEALGTDFRGITKTYDSHLDAALRIFRNDFEQIAYVDDSFAVAGEFQDDTIGTIAGRFYKRDPRIVINVVAGNTYFVQVESGQAYLDGSPGDASNRTPTLPKEFDVRNATGSYQLVINQMPNQVAEIINGQPVLDDHIDNNAQLATVIPISEDLNSPSTNGTGSINGVIDDTPQNVDDTDLFRIITTSEGNMTVRLTRMTGSNLLADLVIADTLGNIVGTGLSQGNGTLTVTLPVTAGQTYYVIVAGTGGNSEGGYRLDVSGLRVIEDHADYTKWWDASDLHIRDFQGTGTANGTINRPGDTDIFRFTFEQFANLTLTVARLDPTLNPAVSVYEVSEDPRGNPIFLRIAVNDDLDPDDPNVDGDSINRNSRVTFQVTPDRITAVPNTGETREYPYYYIVVRGSNPNNDFGDYTLSLAFPASDDHADGDTDADGVIDTGEYAFATPIILDSSTGQGNDTGVIELTTDSDLFKFSAHASGLASVVVSRPTNSLIRTRVTILDEDGTVLATNTADDSLTFFQATASTNVLRGETYFVVVEGFDDPNNPNVNTTDVGDYTLSITAPPIDDHANENEFDLATPIVLNSTTGIGQLGGDAAGDALNPRLSPAGDSDLFTFTTIEAGNVVIRVTPFGSSVGNFAPTLTLFDGVSMTQIGATIVASVGLEEISIAIPNAPDNTTYFVLVGSVAGLPLTTQTGEYRIRVTGPVPSGGNGGDPSDIDFNNPTPIDLIARTGDGGLNDSVGVVNDRDLFTFTTLASGKVFVQITTPSGSLLDASIRIHRAANEQSSSLVVADAGGIPGATANVSFDALQGEQYWVIVDGLGDSIGTYQIRVNTQPLVNQLYFPEGYLNDSISEFISVINPNDAEATFRIIFRYENEDSQLESRTRTLTIGANSRSGVTMRDPWYFEADGVPMLKNSPYAMVIESSLPLGATLAHYDFGNSIGDTFTERLSSSWTFPRVERTPGQVSDFIVFYNPNNFPVNVKLTGYSKDGVESSIELTFPALRRAGYAIDQLTQMPLGVFGAVLTAEAAFPADDANFQGIVASLSHYSPLTGSSFAVLGDPDGGTREGVITNLAQGERFDSEIVLFNPTDEIVNVTITPSYIRTILPQLPRSFQLEPKRTTIITGESLGLVADQPVGITYTASGPVNINANQTQQGDADSTNTSTEAATRFFFGDAYVQSDQAGVLYFETLYMHNPANVATTITVRLTFTDGTTSSVNVNVAAKSFAELELHKLAAVTTQRTGSIWFGVDASAATPFNISMVHYDLALGGGWSTSGIPFGPTNALTTIA